MGKKEERAKVIQESIINVVKSINVLQNEMIEAVKNGSNVKMEVEQIEQEFQSFNSRIDSESLPAGKKITITIS